jgi:hypothetical protein
VPSQGCVGEPWNGFLHGVILRPSTASVYAAQNARDQTTGVWAGFGHFPQRKLTGAVRSLEFGGFGITATLHLDVNVVNGRSGAHSCRKNQARVRNRRSIDKIANVLSGPVLLTRLLLSAGNGAANSGPSQIARDNQKSDLPVCTILESQALRALCALRHPSLSTSITGLRSSVSLLVVLILCLLRSSLWPCTLSVSLYRAPVALPGLKQNSMGVLFALTHVCRQHHDRNECFWCHFIVSAAGTFAKTLLCRLTLGSYAGDGGA